MTGITELFIVRQEVTKRVCNEQTNIYLACIERWPGVYDLGVCIFCRLRNMTIQFIEMHRTFQFIENR